MNLSQKTADPFRLAAPKTKRNFQISFIKIQAERRCSFNPKKITPFLFSLRHSEGRQSENQIS